MTGGALIFAALFVFAFFGGLLLFGINRALASLEKRFDSLEEKLRYGGAFGKPPPPAPPPERLPPFSGGSYQPEVKAETQEGRVVIIENFSPSLEYLDGAGRKLKITEDGTENYANGDRKPIVQILKEEYEK